MSTPSPISGFVLAGGRSARMGRDKALLEWQGGTLLDHSIELLRGVCDPVKTVGRGGLPDATPGLGPLGGIQTALLASSTENNIMVAVDLPLLTPAVLIQIKDQLESGDDLVTCRTLDGYPLCLGIRKHSLDALNGYLASGNRSLHGFINQVPHAIIDGLPSTLFANINTEADYQALRKAHKP